MHHREEISWVINLTSFQFILSRDLLNITLHRITELLRLEGISGDCPAPWSRQGHLEHIVQNYVQLGFGHLQGWRLCSHLRQPVPLVDHPHRKIKPNYTMLKWDILYLIYGCCLLSFSLDTTEKSLVLPSLLCCPSGIYKHS